jgi:hypothetical protein
MTTALAAVTERLELMVAVRRRFKSGCWSQQAHRST